MIAYIGRGRNMCMKKKLERWSGEGLSESSMIISVMFQVEWYFDKPSIGCFWDLYCIWLTFLLIYIYQPASSRV